MIVIAGLGNPGFRYRNTKHNLGFMAVDLLAERHGIKIKKLKHKALSGEGVIADKKVLLLKPQTYMNESGQSVRSVMEYYGVATSDLAVVFDDVDIPLGTLRIRKKGSAGSHNGMKSIIYLLEDDGFPRFRLGIGADRGDVPLSSYVLSGFPEDRVDEVRDAVIRCADAIELWLSDGIDAAMLEYNKDARKKDPNQGDGPFDRVEDKRGRSLCPEENEQEEK